MRDRQKSKYHKFKYFILIVAMLFLTPLVSNWGFSNAQGIRADVETIYVDSRKGGDSNLGSRREPLKTITQALKLAPSGSTVSLAGGTYSEDTGEVFPLVIRKDITLKGISHGQGQGVVIRGGGSFISPTAAEQNVAIAAIKQASAIRGIMVTNPHSRGHGLWIESASPTVSDSTFMRNGNTGLSVNGDSQPLIQNNYFFSNSGNGLLVYGTSRPTVQNNFFDRTGFGASIVQQAQVTLEDNRFQGNRIAIILEGDSQARLRRNSIASSSESGLVAIANSQVDLGTAGDPGNNSFLNNQKHDIQNITPHTISATGNEARGAIVGKIDFSESAISALNSGELNFEEPPKTNFSRLRNNPLPASLPNRGLSQEQPIAINPLPQANPPIRRRASSETLPPPPVIGSSVEETISTIPTIKKELVFSTPDSNSASLARNVTSLSDLLSEPSPRTVKYRVVVEVNSDRDRQEIVFDYPQAFKTVYRGRSMLQVGAFSERTLAEDTSRSLAGQGFRTYILE